MRRPLVRLVAVGLLASAAGAFVAVIQDHAPLWAEAQCQCGRPLGAPTSPVTIPCVGTGTINSETCTPGAVNDPCLVVGNVTWVPSNPSCAQPGSQTGVISPIGSSNAAYFWFDASTTSPVPFGYYSAACSTAGPTAFGWELWVSHNRIGTTPCTCALSGGYAPERCLRSVWTCGN
jgi:hypothetical protein